MTFWLMKPFFFRSGGGAGGRGAEEIKTVQLLLLKVPFHVTLKAPITTGADDIHKYFFIVLQRK